MSKLVAKLPAVTYEPARHGLPPLFPCHLHLPTQGGQMTANPASDPIPTPAMPMMLPRMGRGVRWSDLVREIELDELDRQARRTIETPEPA